MQITELGRFRLRFDSGESLQLRIETRQPNVIPILYGISTRRDQKTTEE